MNKTVCDTENGYFYNCCMHYGKGSDGGTLSDEEKKLLVPAQAGRRIIVNTLFT